MQADTLLGDKAFDADDRVITSLTTPGKTAVIPSKANRRVIRDYDRHLNKARHLIENFFAKLKQISRYRHPIRKTKRSLLAAAIIWLN